MGLLLVRFACSDTHTKEGKEILLLTCHDYRCACVRIHTQREHSTQHAPTVSGLTSQAAGKATAPTSFTICSGALQSTRQTPTAGTYDVVPCHGIGSFERQVPSLYHAILSVRLSVIWSLLTVSIMSSAVSAVYPCIAQFTCPFIPAFVLKFYLC